MVGSCSGSVFSGTELYWDAFAEEEEEVGSCPGAEMEAASPSARSVAAALCFGCAGSSAAASNETVVAPPQVVPRSVKYSVSDDKVLCNAWLSTPDDAQAGNTTVLHFGAGSVKCSMPTRKLSAMRPLSAIDCNASIVEIYGGCHLALGGRPTTREWNIGHCWDILKDSLFVDCTPDMEKRDRLRQVETQACSPKGTCVSGAHVREKLMSPR